MQNENEPKKRFAGKGYYIALIACLAAVGVSGYVFVKTARDSAVETSAAATVPPAVSASAQPETAATPKVSEKPSVKDPMEDSREETMAEAQADPVVWPMQGDILASYSRETLTYSATMADWRTHEGLDIAAEAGDPVCAAQSGTVTAIYEDDFLGNVVVVSHADDVSTLYANLDGDIAVTVGQDVDAGDTLGQVGHSALLETADPDHLHFAVFRSGEPADPLSYLPG